jgi:microcystin-dependent protein
MAEPFLGEIRQFAFGLVPKGWMPCNGQLLPIAQNAALFSILGTTYGGDGRTTFQLPDLRGRLPLGFSQVNALGSIGGETAHALTTAETPTHTHPVQASSAAGSAFQLQNGYWAGAMSYAPAANGTMSPAAIGVTGGGQPHENMQPYTAISFCIALNGIFPSRN